MWKAEGDDFFLLSSLETHLMLTSACLRQESSFNWFLNHWWEKVWIFFLVGASQLFPGFSRMCHCRLSMKKMHFSCFPHVKLASRNVLNNLTLKCRKKKEKFPSTVVFRFLKHVFTCCLIKLNWRSGLNFHRLFGLVRVSRPLAARCVFLSIFEKNEKYMLRNICWEISLLCASKQLSLHLCKDIFLIICRI